MSSDKQELSYEQPLAVEQCADYLESIVAALRAGELRMTYGERELVMNPASQIHTEIKAKQKSKRTSLTLTLSWDHEVPTSKAARLQVISGNKSEQAHQDTEPALNPAHQEHGYEDHEQPQAAAHT